MNKEQVTGTLDETKGKVKEKWCQATDDPQTEAERLVDQAKGKVKKAYGDVKDAAEKELDKP
jgi:uncharacterized protein YjbJ (UPF0337 family)